MLLYKHHGGLLWHIYWILVRILRTRMYLSIKNRPKQCTIRQRITKSGLFPIQMSTGADKNKSVLVLLDPQWHNRHHKAWCITRSKTKQCFNWWVQCHKQICYVSGLYGRDFIPSYTLIPVKGRCKLIKISLRGKNVNCS